MLAVAVSFDDVQSRSQTEGRVCVMEEHGTPSTIDDDGGGAPLVFHLTGMEHLNVVLFHKSCYSKDAVT